MSFQPLFSYIIPKELRLEFPKKRVTMMTQSGSWSRVWMMSYCPWAPARASLFWWLCLTQPWGECSQAVPMSAFQEWGLAGCWEGSVVSNSGASLGYKVSSNKTCPPKSSVISKCISTRNLRMGSHLEIGYLQINWLKWISWFKVAMYQ